MRWWLAFLGMVLAGRASAHASEQGFVLLLPLGHYIAGGVTAVALTVVVIALVPGRSAAALFRPAVFRRAGRRYRGPALSLLALAVLAVGLWQGWTGEQDPTDNPLSLLVWTFLWLFLVPAQAVFGWLWRAVNPWTGVWRLAGGGARLRYPRAFGRWPGVAMLLLFAGYLLADVAPAAPERLAVAAGLYWAVHMAGTLLFGPRWLLSAEALTILTRAYAGLAPRGRHRGRAALGLPGWRHVLRPAPSLAVAVFMVAMLAIGSFDGVNETFWWLALLGQNPLEFTGRSAVVWQNLSGMLVSVALLLLVVAGTLRAGIGLAGGGVTTGRAFRTFAPSILPIALGYHVGHYLSAMLVEGQYLALRLNDPAGLGWNLLGLGHHHVTTGFFNTQATVRVLWLTQGGAVVLGHVLAILMAHVLALRLYGDTRRATLSQLPLAVFMVAYTLFGLWLLAAPRGA